MQLETIIQTSDRTPLVLKSILEGLPEELVHANEGEGTWSSFDVVGHLIHGEHTDWIPRLRRILEQGTSRPFDPFNREAMFQESEGKKLASMLDEFHNLRKENLETLRALNLSQKDFEKEGMHPALGVVTLGQLLSTWMVHDLDHISQIIRVLAKQNRQAVGPWFQYLSVLSERTK